MVTLRVRASIYEFWGKTNVHSIAVHFPILLVRTDNALDYVRALVTATSNPLAWLFPQSLVVSSEI